MNELNYLREENYRLREENAVLEKQLKDCLDIFANYDSTAMVRAALAGIEIQKKLFNKMKGFFIAPFKYHRY